MKMVYYSQAMIKSYVLDLIRQMYRDNFKPEYLVGITRGGLQPALMMSHYTGIEMRTLDVRLRDTTGANREHNKLMIEDDEIEIFLFSMILMILVQHLTGYIKTGIVLRTMLNMHLL